MSILEISDDTFNAKVLESTKPVLVDFWAEWCSPCHILSKTLDEVAGTFADKLNFVKINIDENPNAHTQWGVRALPTLILFNNGAMVASKIGAMSKTQLDEWLSSSLVEV